MKSFINPVCGFFISLLMVYPGSTLPMEYSSASKSPQNDENKEISADTPEVNFDFSLLKNFGMSGCSICKQDFKNYNLRQHVCEMHILTNYVYMCPHPSCNKYSTQIHQITNHHKYNHTESCTCDAELRLMQKRLAAFMASMFDDGIQPELKKNIAHSYTLNPFIVKKKERLIPNVTRSGKRKITENTSTQSTSKSWYDRIQDEIDSIQYNKIVDQISLNEEFTSQLQQNELLDPELSQHWGDLPNRETVANEPTNMQKESDEFLEIYVQIMEQVNGLDFDLLNNIQSICPFCIKIYNDKYRLHQHVWHKHIIKDLSYQCPHPNCKEKVKLINSHHPKHEMDVCLCKQLIEIHNKAVVASMNSIFDPKFTAEEKKAIIFGNLPQMLTLKKATKSKVTTEVPASNTQNSDENKDWKNYLNDLLNLDK